MTIISSNYLIITNILIFHAHPFICFFVVVDVDVVAYFGVGLLTFLMFISNDTYI